MISRTSFRARRTRPPKPSLHTSPWISKKLVLLPFLLVFVAYLLGCGAAQKTITIKLWEFPRWLEHPESIDRFAWMRRQIKTFETMHPEVSVELTELTWERGEDKKRIAIAAGVGPDIITGMLPVQLVERGLIEPIDSYLPEQEKEDFFSPALNAFSYKGRIYGWPWYLTGNVMFVNTGLFKRYGVEPPGPDWDFNRFIDCARLLTRDSDHDGTPEVDGFGFLIRPGDNAAWPFLFPDGIPLPDAGRTGPTELNAALADGIERLRSLVCTERVAPPQSAAWSTEALWQRFTNQGDIAMAPWGIWAIPKLRSIDGFRFDVLPYPSLEQEGSKSPMRAFIGTAGFMVLRQRDPVKREMCMKFAEFLVRPEEQSQLALYGVFPSRRAAGNIYERDGLMTKAQKIVAAGQTIPRHSHWSQIDEKLQREIQLALLGEKSVEVAVSDAGKQVQKIIDKTASSIAPASAAPKSNVIFVLVSAVLVLGIGFSVFHIFLDRKLRSSSTSAFSFLFPALCVFAVFLLFPLCWVVMLAFQEYSIADGTSNWVGLQNMRAVLHDKVFIKSALNTLIYAGVVVPLNTLSALIVASLVYPLSERVRTFFRGAYYLPGVASVVVIAMVWRWMFNENFGLLNAGLEFLGLPGVRWLTNPRVALWSIILMSVTRPPGGPILIYLAALDAIPSSLYDAAEIDGAGPLKRWWHITVPLLRPTTLFLALTMTIASFQVFAQVLILTDGGPGYSTEVVVHRIYTAAIRDFDFGTAAAMSLILFCVIMVISAVQYRFFRSDVEY